MASGTSMFMGFVSTLRGAAPATAKRFAALLVGGLVLCAAPKAEAQCLHCNAATETSSCTAQGQWGFCCVPGFVLANDNANGSATVSMTMGTNSLELLQTFTSDGCCVAPYANIGIFDACQASDQWAQPGSHLPLQLKDIAALNGAWTFQVPMPLKTDWTVEQYRVYFEMFLSTTAAGHADGGNLTVVFFWNNYSFNAATGHANINGTQGMDVIDYHGQVGQGQGPFVDFLFPKGTYAPDTNGVVTISSVDVKAVLDWALKNFPNYYNDSLYLSNLSLAEEAGAFHGTVKTTYASFAVQKAGSDVVFTPSWTSNHWKNCTTAATCDDGDPCTVDACTSGLCSHTQATTAGCTTPTAGKDGGAVTTSSSSSGASSGGSSGGPASSSGSAGQGGSPTIGLHGSSSGNVGGSSASSGTAQNSKGGCSITMPGSGNRAALGTLGVLAAVALAQVRSRRRVSPRV